MSNLKPTTKQQAHAQSYLDLTGEARIRGLIGAFAEDVKSPDEMVYTTTSTTFRRTNRN
jgi:hypothetical protein